MRNLLPIFALVLFCGVADNFSDNPEALETFKTGQILYPSYACTDTLIVIDGEALTNAFTDSDLGTDSEIDSVLHLYSKPY